MPYRVLDLENDPRKAHFAYFSSFANPYVGATVDVEIGPFLDACHRAGAPFFLSFLYCAGRAANAVPQLRRRILEGAPVEFDRCDTSHTVLRPNGTYSYCRLDCMQPFDRYLPKALALHERAKGEAELDDGDDALSLLFISSLPWVRYTALTQPTPIPADSNPRITWGKYAPAEGGVRMPVTLLANHALVDGMHIGAFYTALEEALARWIREQA